MKRQDRFQSLFGLDGKIAVVTGAGAGIGATIARLLAEAGATVVIANRTAEKGERVARALADEGLPVAAIATDVADETQIVRLFADTARRYGMVDILVNCAGITTKHPILEATAADWDKIQATNLRGAFLCLREAAKLMRKGGRGGRIVNVSSVSSQHPGIHGNAAYGASKAGMNLLTASAAFDLAPDKILVNAVLPGAVASDKVKEARTAAVRSTGPFADFSRHLAGRLGDPLEIASAVLFLVSPAGAFVNGQTLVVDGGLVLT